MEKTFSKILAGYQAFRDKYVHNDNSIMQQLANYGQKPGVLVVSCCDSRVDPGLILQCDPGDLFVVRNVANIVPPYEKDEAHHGTSAALEFGICYLDVKHLIILGHSQCGGINALMNAHELHNNDFITNWVSVIAAPTHCRHDIDECAKQALIQSRQNCLTFPWINEKINKKELKIHLWFFDIKQGQIFTYQDKEQTFVPLK